MVPPLILTYLPLGEMVLLSYLTRMVILLLQNNFGLLQWQTVMVKKYFSWWGTALELYVIKNKYIDTSVQKGFLKNVSSTTFALHEELRDAYTHHKQIVISWIDLANTDGSIKHNLIQFALEWYHVPSLIRELIYSYYKTLLFKISTKEWDLTALNFSIGLFQGSIFLPSCLT